jgi:dihydrofolate reductase
MVVAEMSISLDGYVAGPDPSLEDPLGKGGMGLHEWAFRLAAWREPHGLEGGGVDVDSALVEEHLAATGAVVMGRRMFSGGDGPWEDDPNGRGWWGDDPPFHKPVFVVTHHRRERLDMLGGTSFTFVTEGVETAIESARETAGGKDVQIAGGADIVQQSIRAGLVDAIDLHVAPILLGAGRRLFDGLDPARLEVERVLAAPHATHIRYRL